MRVLDELETELTRIASVAPAPRRRRRWPALLGVVPAVGLAAVAVAASSGLLTGAPVRNPPGSVLRPHSGLGTVTPDHVRLLGLRVADPAGGPSWGLRVATTSRGLGCVQVGRVVRGQLGVLGQDGAFGDDGRFHPLATDTLALAGCQLRDGAGHTFVTYADRGATAGGYGGRCAYPAPSRDGVVARMRAAHPGTQPPCPPADARVVFYGLLGPQARAITYRDGAGRTHRAPTLGEDGAYLVVLRPGRSQPGGGYAYSSPYPGFGISGVSYRDGSVCRIPSARRRGGATRCPLKGYVIPRLPKVTHAQVASPVRARFSPGGRLRVSFRARVGADARSHYTIVARPQARGTGCSGFAVQPVARDLDAGAVVSEDLGPVFTGCRGRVRVTVDYAQQRLPGAVPFAAGPGRSPDEVGRVTLPLPR